MIDRMSTEEMKTRLTEYMVQDKSLKAHIVAIEVRRCERKNAKCRYDVVLIDEEGEEKKVKFNDRYSRLIYVYTLMQKEGYQRYKLAANGRKVLGRLYSMLYFKDSTKLLESIEKDFDHFMSQAVAQSRKAIRNVGIGGEELEIGSPRTLGRVAIPFVANGGRVTIDESLLMANANTNL